MSTTPSTLDSTAIIVEDGSVVAGANSYVSLAQTASYMDLRSYTGNWDSKSTSDRVRALIDAAKILDIAFDWQGYKNINVQARAWPRNFCPDPDTVDGYYPTQTSAGRIYGMVYSTYYPGDFIPLNVKIAQMELCLRVLGSYAATAMTGDTPLTDAAVSEISLGQGAVDLKFANNQSSQASAQGGIALVDDVIIRLLAGIGQYAMEGGGMKVIKLIR